MKVQFSASSRDFDQYRLHIRPGAIVLTIARIYRTSERAVETADIIIPVERYALVYDIPVR